MANAGVNGTTVTLGSSTYHGVNFDDDSGGSIVEVSDSGDASMAYVDAQDDPAIEITIVGSTAITKGTTYSACTIAWNDGVGSTSLGACLVASRKTSGGKNAAINTVIRLVPLAT